MNIEQHYLLNLKRRPERLFTWLGAQDQMGFDFSKLTVFEAVDGKSFRNAKEITDYGSRIGNLSYLADRNNNDPNITARGIVAGTLSALVMLKKIAESGSDKYTVIWEDDAVLTIPYRAFALLSLPRNANIATFGSMFAWSNPEDCIEARKNAEIHKRLPFYHGVVGAGFLRCYAVNSEGAEQLLELHREKWSEHFSYEGLMLLNSRLPSLYTYIPEIIRLTCISGITSDIFLEINEHVPWKRMSIKEIYGDLS